MPLEERGANYSPSTPAGGYKASWKRQGLNHCSSALKRPQGRDFQEGSTALHCFLRQTAPVKSCCLVPPPVRALFGRVASPQLARSCVLRQNDASLTATQAVLRPSIVSHLGKGALVILTSESLLFAIRTTSSLKWIKLLTNLWTIGTAFLPLWNEEECAVSCLSERWRCSCWLFPANAISNNLILTSDPSWFRFPVPTANFSLGWNHPAQPLFLNAFLRSSHFNSW